MYILENELKLKEYEFAQRKSLPWELKLYLTENRIREWNDRYDPYISFSGGLDSTVLLHFVRKVLGNEVPAVFCNTGLEYPEIVEFARKATGEYEEIRPDKNFKAVINQYGYPAISKETALKIRKLKHGNLSEKYRNYLLNGDERGKFGMLAKKWQYLIDAPFDISDQCCDVMKKKPFKKYCKKSGRYPFVGVTQDEGFMRENLYSKTGCNVYEGSTIKSQPLGFWTRQDILRYVIENDLEISSVYGDIVEEKGAYRTTGEQRTGCTFCMFGCHLEEQPNRFQRMQKSHPKLHEYCIKPCEKGGLGLYKVLDAIRVPYKDYVPRLKDYEQIAIECAT